MEGDLNLTINAVTLLALAGSAIRISNAITKITTMQESHDERIRQHDDRITYLERGRANE